MVYAVGGTEGIGRLVADLFLAAGESIPQNDILRMAGTVDDRGVPGRERVAQALRDAALGGGSGRYPEYRFVLSFRWKPADPAVTTSFAMDRVALSCDALPAVALFGTGTL